MNLTAGLFQRFEKYVFPEPMSGCWVWVGATANRYGMIWDGEKLQKAHRVSWAFKNGAIPDGQRVLHKCDNTHCVNPDHLFLGTQADNIWDMKRKGRARYVRGEEVGSAKLTELQVRFAREMRGSGWPVVEIAKIFGVSDTVMRAAIQGKSWKHVS